MASLPPLHALAASTTETDVRVVDALTDDARDAIFQMLTDDVEPSKICERWSLWCDVKSGDAMCADTDEGRNHAMWKRGCDALGNGAVNIEELNLMQVRDDMDNMDTSFEGWSLTPYPEAQNVWWNGPRWTWRSYFHAICDALYEHQRYPGGAFGWYKAWLAELNKKRSDEASHNTEWFYRAGGELMKNIFRERKGGALLSVLNEYATLNRYIETEVDVHKRNLDYLLWANALRINEGGAYRERFASEVSDGANPQVAWLLAIYHNVHYDSFPLLVERLLNHSAIHPDLTDFTVEFTPSASLRAFKLEQAARQQQTMLQKVVLEHLDLYRNHPRDGDFLSKQSVLLMTAETLLNAGANPNFVSKRTLLTVGHYRVSKPYLSVSEGGMTDLLLEYGARVDVRHQGDTLVRMSIVDQNKERLKKLVQHGAEIRREDFVSALKLKNPSILQFLMKAGGWQKAGGWDGRLWKMAKKAVEIAELQSELYDMMVEEDEGLAAARNDLKNLLPEEEEDDWD